MDCNCKVLLYTGICAIIFFLVILPMLDDNDNKEKTKMKEHMKQVSNMLNPYSDFNNPEKNEINKFDEKMCSTSCCKHTQWLPTDMNMEKDKNITDNYIGSNLSCNNGTGGGCVCLKKDDIQMLQNKAGNSIPLCNK